MRRTKEERVCFFSYICAYAACEVRSIFLHEMLYTFWRVLILSCTTLKCFLIKHYQGVSR